MAKLQVLDFYYMDLYDIHTHDSVTVGGDDDGVPRQRLHYILNVYPLGFEYAKDSEQCPWFSCGVHPWYSEDADPQIKFLQEIANDHRIVAIGETGLDKLKGPSLSIQKEVFVKQVELAEKLQKPVIIHCVKAWDELLHLKKLIKPRQAWIIHGYRGKPELTKQLISHDFFFSIGEKFNPDSLQEIPLDRLFCETDESDISLLQIYTTIAECLNISVDTLATYVEENVIQTFNLPSTKVHHPQAVKTE